MKRSPSQHLAWQADHLQSKHTEVKDLLRERKGEENVKYPAPAETQAADPSYPTWSPVLTTSWRRRN
eukprot:8738626-Karenia_brevis.AAC.1